MTEDAAKRPYRLYRHTLGSKPDDLIYEEKDELFRLSVERSRSKAYIFVTGEQFDLDAKCALWRPPAPQSHPKRCSRAKQS